MARPGIDGEVIEPASSDAIALALERMRSDEPRRREMGRNAREQIRPYTWGSYGERLLRVYEQIL
jgi:glycosyltransferase involved in cell wall biosynthesis